MADASQYIWKEQLCPNCGAAPTQLLGKRGGKAHRQGVGVETSIWRCTACDLILPNPMPIPKGGAGQHYDVPADDYFKAHDPSTKLAAGQELLRAAIELTANTNGSLLDIGPGRGEILKA